MHQAGFSAVHDPPPMQTTALVRQRATRAAGCQNVYGEPLDAGQSISPRRHRSTTSAWSGSRSSWSLGQEQAHHNSPKFHSCHRHEVQQPPHAEEPHTEHECADGDRLGNLQQQDPQRRAAPSPQLH
eukprot:36994-Pleurochrysis_carterae.AAC.1